MFESMAARNERDKVGSLSLYMQKFEISPTKYELEADVSSEEIMVPTIRIEDRPEITLPPIQQPQHRYHSPHKY